MNQDFTNKNSIRIPSKTWWEMRRLKYNILVGLVGIFIIINLNFYIKKGTTFDFTFFIISISVGIIYALLCNFTFNILWLLDNLSFGNDMIDFHSTKRTIILYIFVFLSCIVPFGILYLVKDLL